MSEEEKRDIHWSEQLEVLIAQEAEKCRGLAWIHQRAEAIATTRANFIAIPVIILSTLCGTASMSSSTLFGAENQQISNTTIGLVSIAVGILNTINSYFAFSRKAEGSHIAYLQYSKLFSWISVELSLPRAERMIPSQMLEQLRSAMERLAETTPTPPTSVIDEFNKQFKNYSDISKPIETNGLTKVKIYREIKTPLQETPIPEKL
jgi:hypothetical protein